MGRLYDSIMRGLHVRRGGAEFEAPHRVRVTTAEDGVADLRRFPFFHARDTLWNHVGECRADARAATDEWRRCRALWRDATGSLEDAVERGDSDYLLKPERARMMTAHRMYLDARRERDRAARRVQDARRLWRRAIRDWVVWSSWGRRMA